MNTPAKSQIGSSLTKFEDSQVFNYLDNLSPIKPVKSATITQTYNFLNFSSLQSIFTSPRVGLQKESIFLRRHNTPSKSQSEFEYIDPSSIKESEVLVDENQLRNNSSDLHWESAEPDLLGEAHPEPLNAEFDSQMELYQDIKYNCGSGIPESESKPGFSANGDGSYLAEGLVSSDMIDQRTSISRPAIHKSPSGWESLYSDGADLLMFDSPNLTKDLKELFKSPPVACVDSSLATQFKQDNSDFLKSDTAFQVDVGEFQSEFVCAEIQARDCTHNDYPSMIERLTSHPNENADDEPITNLHQGLHRRCLVFDPNAAHGKNLLGASSSNISMYMKSDQNVASNIWKPVSNRTISTSSLRLFSGIGLHLNTLAPSGEQVMHIFGAPSCSTWFQSPTTTTEASHDAFNRTPLENSPDSNPTPGSDDAILAKRQVSVDDDDQTSPRKKRQKTEISGDGSCKRCNCKKSKCLKLYCECFAAGVYCAGDCACQNCCNKLTHKETVLSTRKQIESRNPLAFAPKVIRTSADVKDEMMNTPASARHKRGCNCKKSSCQKKYCECYQSGVGCSVNCRCETCKNMFGTKDGSASVEEKFESKGKLPISSFLTDGSTSGLNGSQKFGEPNHLNPSKIQSTSSAGEDETEIAEMLRSNGSPDSNSKKILSPSSGRSSTRKMILQSIPSFPSLNQP